MMFSATNTSIFHLSTIHNLPKALSSDVGYGIRLSCIRIPLTQSFFETWWTLKLSILSTLPSICPALAICYHSIHGFCCSELINCIAPYFPQPHCTRLYLLCLIISTLLIQELELQYIMVVYRCCDRYMHTSADVCLLVGRKDSE